MTAIHVQHRLAFTTQQTARLGLFLGWITLQLSCGFLRPLHAAEGAPALLGSTFPKASIELPPPPSEDWLLTTRGSFAASRVGITATGKEVVLENGLIRRVIRIAPNGATTGLDDLRTGQRWLRSVRPEMLLTLDGKAHVVGGLSGHKNHAYLTPEWIEAMTNNPGAFQLTSIQPSPTVAAMEWKRVRHHDTQLAWPPKGAGLIMRYEGSTAETRAIEIIVHYEIYDGIPVIGKWFELKNGTGRTVTLDQFTLEQLAVTEVDSAVDERERHQWRTPPISVLSDYSFKGMDPVTATRVASWETDPQYLTQVNYERRTPSVLTVKPPIGPGIRLEAGGEFKSFRSYLVVSDSGDRERQGLGLRRAWRTLAPWTTENPVMMHVRNADTKAFRLAVDQCAEVGFEMIIYTFGSGLEMEKDDPAYWAKVKEDVDYARSKGIEVGGYSLFSSRRIDDANDVINPKTGKPGGAIFGNAPCLASHWGTNYVGKIRRFLSATGFALLEHDGPYPGDICASTNHPGHHGMADSQWVQWQMSRDLYSWCRSQGIYINQPDSYFLAGGNKTAMGYREDNWSLPRPQQLIHARQNIYDGTWEKTPSMGWMFVPLTEYHGGGKAATLEPLKDHLSDYELHLANTLGAGVQACWRGPRLYDSDETKALVQKWVKWFKQHRDILESDLIHGARANGQDIDWYLHVNPNLSTRAMLVLFNPLDQPLAQTLRIPLYYSGLTGSTKVKSADGKTTTRRLDSKSQLDLPITMGPKEVRWITFER